MIDVISVPAVPTALGCLGGTHEEVAPEELARVVMGQAKQSAG